MEMERELRRISAALELITQRIGVPELPSVLTKKRAAKELSVSVSKLKRMIRDGRIFTVEIGRTQMVPAREIERLATPVETKTRKAKKTPLRVVGADEAAKVRAALKR
jgi:hypothetical protein